MPSAATLPPPPARPSRVLRFVRWLHAHTHRPWYPAAAATSAAADAVAPIAPTNTLLVLTVLLRPDRWRFAPLWFAAGATLGAVVLLTAVRLAVATWFPGLTDALDPAWAETLATYGPLGIFAVACLPLSMRTATIASALVGMPLLAFAIAFAAGRLVAYSGVSWVARHSPHLLRRVPMLRRVLDRLPGPNGAAAVA